MKMEEDNKTKIDMASEPLLAPYPDQDEDVMVVEEERIWDDTDFSFIGPRSEAEALARIAEAEKGIAMGEVVDHDDVMKATFKKLADYGCQMVR